MIRATNATGQSAVTGEAGATPARTCIVTRAVRPPDELIRFVTNPAGQIVPDIARKLPGRGVWLECNREIVKKATETGAFNRALRRKVAVGDDLADQVDKLLLRRTCELLSLCNKAGLVTVGAVKVNSWAEAGANGTLLQASDGRPDGTSRLSRKYRAVCEAFERQPTEVSLLTIEQLSLAIGRSNVVHAAIDKARAAEIFLLAVRRLAQYRRQLGNFSDGQAVGAAQVTEPRHPRRNAG